jgi:hypothetical protein
MKFYNKNLHKTALLQPILPLQRIANKIDAADKSRFITFDLKVRAGAANATSTYKKTMRTFETGSPQEWLDVIAGVQEIWRQNSIVGPHDRAGILMALIKGDALTAFETALEQARTDPNPQVLALVAMTTEHVETAIANVTDTVFPFRALETQKLWMERYMKKPFDMSMKNTNAALSRINNCLPLFPLGNDQSKFDENKLVSLLEMSLPQSWRDKFDKKGYIPSSDTRAKLVTEGEIIERHETVRKHDRDDDDNNNKNNKKSKFIKSAGNNKKDGSSNNGRNAHFCKECGPNASHSTVNCFKIKNRAARGNNTNGQQQTGNGNTNPPNNANKPFSKRTFRKEVNALVRKAGRKDALEICATALKREQAKVNKTAKKASKKSSTSKESESESSDESVHNLEKPIPRHNYKGEHVNVGYLWSDPVQDIVYADTGERFKNPYAYMHPKVSAKYIHDKARAELSIRCIETMPYNSENYDRSVQKHFKKVTFDKASLAHKTRVKEAETEVSAEETAFLRAVDKMERQSNKDKKKMAKTNILEVNEDKESEDSDSEQSED